MMPANIARIIGAVADPRRPRSTSAATTNARPDCFFA
jgi:hypothetical protein